jgi:tryptophanyl-tRNA synthetase
MTYPILMACDILLYGAEYIPVGEDQQQHLEYTRDIAARINNKFADKFPHGIFKLPKTLKAQLEYFEESEAVRIRSLSNPSEKMSKSVTDPKGTILLIDSPSDAAKKVMSAQTDNEANIQWNWETQPGITNLLQLHALMSGGTLENTKKTWIGQTRYGELKKEVASLIEDFLTRFQENLAKISTGEVEKILEKDEEEVNKIAKQTLYKVQQAVGLRSI